MAYYGVVPHTNQAVLFVHVWRTGGTSLRTILQRCLQDQQELGAGHVTAEYTRGVLEQRGVPWEQVYSFGCVRNPFDWLVSLYYYCKREVAHNLHQESLTLPAAEFIKFYLENLHHRGIDTPQTGQCVTPAEFLGGATPIVTQVLRFENYAEDVRQLARKLDLDFAPVHVNAAPRAISDWRAHYTPEVRALVEQHCRLDLDLYGYSFDSE